MRKTLALAFSLLFFLPALPSSAQEVTPSISSPPIVYQYCILVVDAGFFNTSEVGLEFGQSAQPPVKDAELLQDQNNIRQMHSIVAALNYMSGRGWEFLETRTTPTSIGSYVGYLLRRPQRPIAK
ncbi:hypothetical protein ACFP2F_22560 [Hymenobacter artigasi]|uniref:DUF4177 domain-containing protein n=1 Tax=Hymenobacter artigasi TaxID=2719616 RepID=A0ABX1HP33_9BACT|nr:hypothetical protein [Hymenobacter artigasi]NKI92013.1 hypothetical protein [Hymenobacter artigasi]